MSGKIQTRQTPNLASRVDETLAVAIKLEAEDAVVVPIFS